MLIVNADDWGRNATSTNNALMCFQRGRITSVTAMMFMVDSERSADLTMGSGLEVGLHLNFTERFTGNNAFTKLQGRQERIASFLLSNKYSQVLYNPFLKNDFEYLYNAQYDEYVRIYKGPPTHFDGHHHRHLCTNVLLAGLITANNKVRRSFSFVPGEKGLLNRLYRQVVDACIKHKYVSTDFFYSIAPIHKPERLTKIVELSASYNIELMVHPELQAEYEYLMTDEYMETIHVTKTGTYLEL